MSVMASVLLTSNTVVVVVAGIEDVVVTFSLVVVTVDCGKVPLLLAVTLVVSLVLATGVWLGPNSSVRFSAVPGPLTVDVGVFVVVNERVVVAKVNTDVWFMAFLTIQFSAWHLELKSIEEKFQVLLFYIFINFRKPSVF